MTRGAVRPAGVQFLDVSKQFGDGPFALRNLDLTIEPGEFLTLLGPSGSGKTTALNLLAGFIHPTSGEIQIDGGDIGDLPAHKRDIGVVFQHYALFPHMTVRDNIAYPLKQRRLPRADIDRKVDAALAMVALEKFADRLPRQLSGGQQQRVAVARATVFEPRLLLMDEPLGALDKKLRESVQLELKRLHQQLGATIVFVTHDQEEALVMSDRIAVFDDGKVQQIGTAQQLYDAPETQFVAQFIGESNCWIGDVIESSAENVVVSAKGWRLIGARLDCSPLKGRAAVIVRPERTKIMERGAMPAGWNELHGRLRDVIYLGSLRKVIVELESGGEAAVTCQPDAVIPSQAAVSVVFPPPVAQVIPAGRE